MSQQNTQEVTNKIFTAANVISFVRLCLVPVFMVLLLGNNNVAAAVVFAIAAGTDFLDGQVARRTNTVSKLGQLLDPTVDRLLMICAVVGLLVVSRLPMWVVVLVLCRDVLLLLGGAYLLKKWAVRVDVIFLGKIATTLLFIGLFGLILNMPLIPGLGITTLPFFPGLSGDAVSWGIWFIYIGLFIGIFTTLYYILKAYRLYQRAKRRRAKGKL